MIVNRDNKNECRKATVSSGAAQIRLRYTNLTANRILLTSSITQIRMRRVCAGSQMTDYNQVASLEPQLGV